MNGKILKIANNDLYGNVDERKVVAFAAFIHKKYMNKYIIFTFEGEYNKNKLYLASVHLKDNSLVVFNIKNDEINYINDFVNAYLSNKVDPNEYEILDIANINKIELVSYYEEDFDKLSQLDQLSIERVVVTDNNQGNKKGYGFLYFILFILILLLIGITYLYFNPDMFVVELKKLNCTGRNYDDKLELYYSSEAELMFDKDNELTSFQKIDTYSFDDEDTYLKFKFNNDESKYFNIDGAYKYDDDNFELKLIYNEKLIIYKYDEVLGYLKNNGYTCVEGIYNE